MAPKRLFLSAFLLAAWAGAFAQAPAGAPSATVLPQQRLEQWAVAPGNYSGIARVGETQYAVVCDKAVMDGFFLFTIEQNAVTGAVEQVKVDAWRGQTLSNRDAEGIAYHPVRNSVFISGEGDQQIREYTLEGALTGFMLEVPEALDASHIHTNYGFEALTYDERVQRFFTLTESALPADAKPSGPLNPVAQNPLRLQAFTDAGEAAEQYLYFMDAPQVRKYGKTYVMGVVALAPAPNGGLLVLEREANVPKAYLGAMVWNKLYYINPTSADAITPFQPLDEVQMPLQKTLVAEWRTALGVGSEPFANYEGMCWGRRLEDGRQTLLLLNDSQGGYGKGPVRLKDFIKVVVLE